MQWLQLAGRHFVRYHETNTIGIRLFANLFGTNPTHCTEVWMMMQASGWLQKAPSRILPVHLLWALFFMRHYLTTEVNAAIVGVSSKTFQEKAWFIVLGLSSLYSRVVSFLSCVFVFCFEIYFFN